MKSRNKGLSGLPGGKFVVLQREKIRLQVVELKKKFDDSKYRVLLGEKKPLVSLIILSLNDVKHLKVLMKSLKKCCFYNNFEIVFVDMGSADGSVEYMETWRKVFSIKFAECEEKMSFSAARNRGVKYAEGEYLLFLSSHIKVTHRWLDELLLSVYADEYCGAVGACLVYPQILEKEDDADRSFKVHHMGIAFQAKKREKKIFYAPQRIGHGKPYDTSVSGIMECAAVASPVLMVSKAAYEAVGGFDENYIREYEDVDLCLKLLKAGYHNYINPACLVYCDDIDIRDKNEEDSDKKRTRHDIAVWKGRWHRYLSRAILDEKLQKRKFLSTNKLTITFATTKEREEVRYDKEDSPILAYADILQRSGFTVRYLNQDKKNGTYNIGIQSDILISVDPEYDITRVENVKDDLIKVAWIQQNLENWKEKAYYESFDLSFDLEQGKKVQDFLGSLLKYNEDQVNEKVIDIVGAMPENETKKFWGDWHYALAIKKEFEKKGYKANVLTREHLYDRSHAKYTLVLRGVMEYYPSQEENRKVIMWNISHPADVPLQEYNLFDYVFFASSRMKKEIGSKIRPDSGVLLQCTDPEVMQCEERKEKKYELLFVGNSRRVYRQILKDLLPTEFRLSVYGRHWEEYPVQEYVVRDYIENDLVGQAYHDAKILLNDHWNDMLQYGIISNRIFDALSVGAFVISDYMPEIDELFDGAVVTYRGREDLKQKISYYLQHEEERMEKAAWGKQIVRREHTFANRIEKMVNVIQTSL